MRNSKHTSKENNQLRFHGKSFENVDFARFRFTAVADYARAFLEFVPRLTWSTEAEVLVVSVFGGWRTVRVTLDADS